MYSNLQFNLKWEKIRPEKFADYLDVYNNFIFFGRNDNKGEQNQDIYGLNLENNQINIIGKIDTCALYSEQNIQLNDSIFAINDMKMDFIYLVKN